MNLDIITHKGGNETEYLIQDLDQPGPVNGFGKFWNGCPCWAGPPGWVEHLYDNDAWRTTDRAEAARQLAILEDDAIIKARLKVLLPRLSGLARDATIAFYPDLKQGE